MERLVRGGDEPPDVAGQEQGHDRQGDPGEAVLLLPHHRVLHTQKEIYIYLKNTFVFGDSQCETKL